MSRTFIEHYRLLQRIHEFIRRKGTGRYDAFASRLGIPASSFYRRLDELRELGAEIVYDRERESYVYLNDFYFEGGEPAAMRENGADQTLC